MLVAGSLQRATVPPDRETLVLVAPDPATWRQTVVAETASAIGACPVPVDPVTRAPSAEAPEGSAETARGPAVHVDLPALVEEAVAGAVVVADAGESTS